jgi:hypothetical protein
LMLRGRSAQGRVRLRCGTCANISDRDLFLLVTDMLRTRAYTVSQIILFNALFILFWGLCN